MRLLILNCYSRNALAVINALDRGYELWGGASANDNYFICNPDRWFRSPRLDRIVRYADPSKDAEAWAEEIAALCRAHDIDGVIATGTTTTNALSKYKAKIEGNTAVKCAVEDYDLLGRATDKWLAYELCREVGVAMPKTALFRYDAAGLEQARALTFPVVVKPRMSYASIGVRFFDTFEDLAAAIRSAPRENSASDGHYVIQERIEGRLHDVTSFAVKGQIKALMSQQRVVTLYDFGGGGIINRTTDEPELRQIAQRFLERTGWTGVLLFDFIRSDATGEYLLLECNPKFWGATELTIKAGLNVAQMTVDHFVLGKEVSRIEDYEKDLVFKWQFPECAYHLVHKPRTVPLMLHRARRVLSRHQGKRVINNLHPENLRHLLGIVFDRAKL